MKFLLLGTLLIALFLGVVAVVPSSDAEAACYGSTYVNGYYRSNGTYVSGHYRTCPNNSIYDNYSYSGNYNPYTGQYGTRRYSPPDYGWSSSWSNRSNRGYNYTWSSPYYGGGSSWSYGYNRSYSYP